MMLSRGIPLTMSAFWVSSILGNRFVSHSGIKKQFIQKFLSIPRPPQVTQDTHVANGRTKSLRVKPGRTQAQLRWRDAWTPRAVPREGAGWRHFRGLCFSLFVKAKISLCVLLSLQRGPSAGLGTKWVPVCAFARAEACVACWPVGAGVSRALLPAERSPPCARAPGRSPVLASCSSDFPTRPVPVGCGARARSGFAGSLGVGGGVPRGYHQASSSPCGQSRLEFPELESAELLCDRVCKFCFRARALPPVPADARPHPRFPEQPDQICVCQFDFQTST